MPTARYRWGAAWPAPNPREHVVQGGVLLTRWRRYPAGRWWLVTLALGIVITFRAGGTVRAVAVHFGTWLLALGVFWIVLAIAEYGAGGGGRVALVFRGLLGSLIGLLVPASPV
jgi:uncharacterized membrane protein HdeD (DUF308 family)